MQPKKYWIAALLMVAAALPLSACGESSSSAADESEPAKVEQVNGTELVRMTLTDQAAKRIGVKTAPVRVEGGRKVIPYSAVLYGTHGETFAYSNPEGLTFVRADIKVDHITGSKAVLAKGPATGTEVATVGGAELLGTETEDGGSGH